MTAHAARVELQTNFSIKFFTYLLISLKLVKDLVLFSHFPAHLGGSFLNWAAKIRTFLLPANFFATFFKIFFQYNER